MSKIFVSLLISLVFFLVGCKDNSPKTEVCLKVNDFVISEDEVNSQLKFEAELDSNFYASEDTRTEFIQSLIQTQLLIQEAKRQKMDQRESFRQTIQRYWESTLIRDLLAEKGELIRATTVVSLEEIETYYKENKEFLRDGSFEELKPEIEKVLESRKIDKELKTWIGQLKSNADIEVSDSKLAANIQN